MTEIARIKSGEAQIYSPGLPGYLTTGYLTSFASVGYCLYCAFSANSVTSQNYGIHEQQQRQERINVENLRPCHLPAEPCVLHQEIFAAVADVAGRYFRGVVQPV